MKKNKYEIDMCNGTIMDKLISFSLPLMVSGILQLMFNAVDIIVVGRFSGSQALAAVGSTTALINVFINLFMGISLGANVLAARYYAAGRDREMSETVHTSIMLALISGVVMAFVGVFFAKGALELMDTPADVIDQSALYMRIYFMGMPFFMLYNYGAAILRAVGDTKRPLYFLIVASLVNIVLDVVFIAVFHWGVAGAALATVLAQLVSTIGCFIYAFVRYPVLRLHREDWRITMMDVKRHLTRGIPLGLQFSVLAIGIIVMQGGVVQFDMRDGVMVSNAAQNGFGAANRLFNLVATPMNALGGAMTSFTAQNLGAGQYDRIRRGTLQALDSSSMQRVIEWLSQATLAGQRQARLQALRARLFTEELLPLRSQRERTRLWTTFRTHY